MTGTSDRSVILVDALSFRRARDHCFLAPWAEEENVELVSVGPEEAQGTLSDDLACGMIIYQVGGASPSSHEIIDEIQALHTLRPEAALVLIADDGWHDSIIATINAGVRGYLTNEMPPSLARQALSFVLHGGTYFPPTAIVQHLPRSGSSRLECEEHLETRNPAQSGATLIERPSHVEPSDIPFDVRTAIALFAKSNHGMTDRQQSVLEGLCRGEPNKVIGRKLGMTETTVKTHVREIMRRLGVANRTQVALAVRLNGQDSDFAHSMHNDVLDDDRQEDSL